MNQLQRLVRAGVLSSEYAELISKMQSHLARHAGKQQSVGEIAVEYGFATDAAISQALATTGSEVHLQPIEVPPHLLRQLQIKPLGLSETTLKIGALTPLSDKEKTELVNACWRLDSEVTAVEEVSMDAKEILSFLQELAADAQTLVLSIDRFNASPEDGSVSDVLKGILNEAVQEKASDVHLRRDTDILNCLVRYRIDGKLQVRHLLTPEASRVLSARIKNDAGMDYAKIREPQDGRLSWSAPRRNVDIRVASLPAGTGEEIVLRLLDPANQRPLPLQLRDSPAILERVQRYTRLTCKTSGLLLVTGPTGSGKSSFLSGLVGQMDRLGLAIATAEDPVEQLIRAVTQTSVSSHTGFGFAEVLRAQMRADPDVLIVGEIRDRATAEAALRSAESGHFVASTLHAASCEESIQRLLNMLVAEYRSVGELSISNYLQMVLNLRLAPRVCTCATHAPVESVIFSSKIIQRLGLEEGYQVLVPKGCPKCRNTGFSGRVLVPEALFIAPDVSTRKELLDVISGKSNSSVTEVSGVEHFARETAVRKLLISEQLDARTAAQVLGEFV